MKRLILVILLLLLSSCTAKKADSKQLVFVSILPQKHFVQKIVGDTCEVEVMVRPGHGPHSYEPLPSQLAELSKAALYFRIGVPFEEAWIDKISSSNPQLRIIDTRKGVELRKFNSFEHEDHDENIKDDEHDDHHDENHEEHTEHDEDHDHDHLGLDPHIWLSPSAVKIQAFTIYEALIDEYPENKELYKKNLDTFVEELDAVSLKLHEQFEKIPEKEFIVFHPAFGYFADEFGLKQLPIEIEGKEPGPKQLEKMIRAANAKSIKVIFVQKQFSTKSAKALAEGIDGVVVAIDPLSEDYINNLENIAIEISKGLTE